MTAGHSIWYKNFLNLTQSPTMPVKTFFALLFILATGAFAQQDRQALHGRVVYDDMPLQDILVVNLQSQKEIRTDSLGNFKLDVKTGDELVVTSPRIREQRHKLADTDITPSLHLYSVEVKDFELKEVVIERKRILSSILNIPMGAKYTPAERRVATAASMKPALDQQMTGGFLPLDPLFNAISGRTKSLKKVREVEKSETAMASISALYPDDHIVAEFNIPAEYVKGFLFYAAENIHIAKALKDNNTELAKKFISQLALKYLNLLNDE